MNKIVSLSLLIMFYATAMHEPLYLQTGGEYRNGYYVGKVEEFRVFFLDKKNDHIVTHVAETSRYDRLKNIFEVDLNDRLKITPPIRACLKRNRAFEIDVAAALHCFLLQYNRCCALSRGAGVMVKAQSQADHSKIFLIDFKPQLIDALKDHYAGDIS
jgi:hypothetical protein